MSLEHKLNCTHCRHLEGEHCKLHGVELPNPAFNLCSQCVVAGVEAEAMPRQFPDLLDLSPEWIYALDPAGEATPLVQVARRRRSRPPTGQLRPLPELPEGRQGVAEVALDRFVGTLVGLALGEALGLPAEGRSPEDVEMIYGGPLRGLVQRIGRRHTWPLGQVAKDTQLVQVFGASLVAQRGDLDLDDVADRLVRWLPTALKPGKTTVQAVTALRDGLHWSVSGVESNGAGGSARLAPLALVRHAQLGRLRQEAVLQCLVTHKGAKALAGAVLFGTALAALVATPRGGLDREALLSLLERAIRGIDMAASARLLEVRNALAAGTPAEELVRTFRTGGFVLECLPSALACFLSHPEDPEQALLTAVNAGFDACATGALTGALAGAYLGRTGLPGAWASALSVEAPLTDLAGALHALPPPGPSAGA
ncbi:MAG: ADP-ribosylglycohydrolase family protein [Candidatus Sericytochromatia bacterium]|nr:ADP-ribosylglycohydrolase family protein [Candidatus Sericytochromatia bacterium]